jgi:hypothetical protein
MKRDGSLFSRNFRQFNIQRHGSAVSKYIQTDGLTGPVFVNYFYQLFHACGFPTVNRPNNVSTHG